jgi:hypothetical protein
MHRPWHHLNPFHRLEALAEGLSGVVHSAHLDGPVSFLVARESQRISNHGIAEVEVDKKLTVVVVVV